MRYSKKTMIIGTVAATVGLAAIAGPVLAANIVSHDDQREQQQEAFEKSLAEKLGVPQADVDKALKEIQGDRLGKRIDELQKDGALTVAQATSIKAQIADGKLPEAVDTAKLLKPAADAGIAYNAGPEWACNPGTGRSSMRLCFALPTKDEIRAGVAALAAFVPRASS